MSNCLYIWFRILNFSILLWMTPPTPLPTPTHTHLAPNSLTTVKPISLKTLWLFWVCWTPSVCYSADCCRLWGRRFFFFYSMTKRHRSFLPIFSIHWPPPPSPRSTFAFSPRHALFALFYPFAPTSGNRKWHWPLLIPPRTPSDYLCEAWTWCGITHQGTTCNYFCDAISMDQSLREAASGAPLAAMVGASSDPRWLTALVIKWLYRPLRLL